MDEDVEVEVEPQAIVDKWVIHEGPLPLTQVLAQWTHLHPDNTTWEYLLQLLKQFQRAAQLLTFLGDKKDFKGRGLS